MKKDNSVSPQIAAWLRKAQEDEFAVMALLKEKVSISNVVFFSQQIVEKLMKAFLIHLNIEPPKTHDLVKLESMICEHDSSFNQFHSEFEQLCQYYIETRYPGDWPEGIDIKEAKIAFESALKIKDFIFKKLGI